MINNHKRIYQLMDVYEQKMRKCKVLMRVESGLFVSTTLLTGLLFILLIDIISNTDKYIPYTSSIRDILLLFLLVASLVSYIFVWSKIYSLTKEMTYILLEMGGKNKI